MSTLAEGSEAPRGGGSAIAAARGLRLDTAPDAADARAAGHDETIPRSFLILVDVLVLVLAFLTAYLAAPPAQRLLVSSSPLQLGLRGMLSVPGTPTAAFPPLFSMFWVLAVTIPATVMFMELFGAYRPLVDQSRTRLIGGALLASAIGLSFSSLVVFALKLSQSSRLLIFTYALLTALGLVTYRVGLRGYKRRRLAAGAYARNVLLIAQPGGVVWMLKHFQESVEETRFRLAGWLSIDSAASPIPDPRSPIPDPRSPIPDPRSPIPDPRSPIPRLGSVDDLGSLLVHKPIHDVIAVQSAADRDWLAAVIEACDYFRVRLRIVPEALLAGNLRDLQLTYRGDPLRLPEVVLTPRHFDSDVLFIKRLFDIVVSATLLALLSPILLLVALAIKITTPDLPVFYPWRVVGLKGRPFVGYKFTTMVANAEERRQELLDRNEMQGPVFKVKDDPRVTPIGRFLRTFSLNELPQLWSVLKGDMSLVGPRPAFRHELERYELWHKRKLCVKPGITCLWQVSGRNKINDFDEWVKLDLQYIDEWSLSLDVRILARTVWAVVRGTGS